MTKRHKGRLGLDLGGTLLRACYIAEDGGTPRWARIKTPGLPGLPRALAALKNRWKIGHLEALTLGATGVWTLGRRRAVQISLRKAARRVRVTSDVELAHRAAFGAGAGILVIAGTGSIAFGRDPKGRSARAGGWGALLGDEGSAFWIGREALKDPRLAVKFPPALHIAHGGDTVRQTAALARRVIRLAPQNRAAGAILDRAAAHLARLALEVKSELGWRGKIPVSWTGGLFRSRLFLDKFKRALRQADSSFIPQPTTMSPEEAAARWPTD